MFINNRWILIFIASLILVTGSSQEQRNYFDSTSYNLHSLSKSSLEHITENQISLVELQNFVKKNLSSRDPMESLYQEPATQWIVEDYLRRKIHSDEIIDTVLLYTTQKQLPISIVFSLVFVESSYSTQAVNYGNKNNSQDFGLFQLNSKTFSFLSEEDFFHLDTNVDNGTSYLAYAFSLDPDPRVALSIYNAGPGRPLRGETPDSTKLYVNKILNYSQDLQRDFVYYVWKKFELESFQEDV